MRVFLFFILTLIAVISWRLCGDKSEQVQERIELQQLDSLRKDSLRFDSNCQNSYNRINLTKRCVVSASTVCRCQL